MIRGQTTTKLKRDRQGYSRGHTPLVSVVVPAYNEAVIIESHLFKLCEYMESLEDKYRWELIIVNDGSTDQTGDLAEAFAMNRNNVHVLQNTLNSRLGHTLRSAFNNCQGDYIVTMDLDLSYSLDHIERLVARITESRAKIVIASPYMRGGKVSNVPWGRRVLSRWANRFLALTAKGLNASGNLSTLTSMVRAYDRRFLRALDLRAMGMEINAEIIYKSLLLHARIEEIPAHLDWSFQKAEGKKRSSSMRILRNIRSYLFAGFIFRPFLFFILPAFVLLLLSTYTLMWVFVHTLVHYQNLPAAVAELAFYNRLAAAIAAAFTQSAHAFVVGGITLMLAIQLFSLGILALQSKRYFEELFHLSTTIYKYSQENQEIDRRPHL